jgi:hypothetical protein
MSVSASASEGSIDDLIAASTSGAGGADGRARNSSRGKASGVMSSQGPSESR